MDTEIREALELCVAVLSGDKTNRENLTQALEAARTLLNEQPSKRTPAAWMTDQRVVCGEGITKDASVAESWRKERWRVVELRAESSVGP